jgi:hypothetical protein
MAKRVWLVALTSLMLGLLGVAGARAQGPSLALGDKGYRGGRTVAEPGTGLLGGAGGVFYTPSMMPHGSIVAWRNECGEFNVPGANTTSVSVVAGVGFHRLGSKDDGSILAWAYNAFVKVRSCDLAGIGTNPRLSLDVSPVGKLGVKIDLRMVF